LVDIVEVLCKHKIDNACREAEMKRFVLLLIMCTITVLHIGNVQAAASIIVKADVGVAVNGEAINLEREPVAINGRVLVPARTVFEKLGARVDWYPESGQINVVKDDTTIAMQVGYLSCKVNNVYTNMDTPPILGKGTVMVPVRFVAEALGISVSWDGRNRVVQVGQNDEGSSISRGNDKREPIVVIDPGHGGKEPGAVYGGIKEKDLNLDVAKRLNKLLKDEGIKTYMTRSDDSYVSLYSRSDFANKLGADLFISIHHNAGKSSYSGTMTLYYPGSGEFTSKDLASIVQRELTGKLGSKNLGLISRPNLAVLRTTNMPAVIAEIGYMTNKTELNKLKTSAYRQKSAEALKNAILKALDKK